ncbi:ADP-ribose pyrophosphatase YjhB (NUDIX family) [Leucobacter luti]|uniref:ADP-ribose pyrophosphatase YjhB (NUDIX family) n=1 Tax=Leucobacter luti TaxID=340320 RepID=A0A4R6RZ23_9MICO|nr:NUDIX hydrolase [Leucobacter luti]TDP92401.1 ADP-ribose pyrophosphatase YjhB (NUDIX family) [Leucobacter luti]
MTTWKQPLISVDVFAVRNVAGRAQYATHERLLPPFAGEQALPGVLLLSGESLIEAAERALSAKLDFHGGVRRTHQFGAFDGTNRDPRGATISIGHIVVLEPDLVDESPGSWHDAAEMVSPLPFDHELLVREALSDIRRRMWADMEFTRALIGDSFTTGEALALSKQLGATLPERESNLARWLRTRGGAHHEGAATKFTRWRW